jgi:hypothetical protein
MAAELILILRDFFAPGDPVATDAERPRLQALETLLATARRDPLMDGWRAEFAARFSDPSDVGLSPAAVVAHAGLAAELLPETRYWLATPVHYFAGLDSVQLHPAGLLELERDAQSALASDFNAVFGEARWRLLVTGRRELVLAGPALQADGEDPARFLGSQLDGAQPRGPGAPELRRLAVEIEMWLHEHPLNQRRENSGQPPISGLWLWGAEPLRAVGRVSDPSARAGERLYGQDTFAEALWQRRGGSSVPLPARWSARHESGKLHVVLYPAAGADGVGPALERLERDWLAPALAALRAGAVAAVELLAGAYVYRLRRLGLARFWRARAPWHEALA